MKTTPLKLTIVLGFFLASSGSIFARKPDHKCKKSDLETLVKIFPPDEDRLNRTSPIEWDSVDFDFIQNEIGKFSRKLIFRSFDKHILESEDLVNLVLLILYQKSQTPGVTWRDIYNQIPVITQRSFIDLFRLRAFRKGLGSRTSQSNPIFSLDAGESPFTDLLVFSDEFSKAQEQIEARDFIALLETQLTSQEIYVLKGLFFDFKEGVQLARELHVSNPRITHIKHRIFEKAKELADNPR